MSYQLDQGDAKRIEAEDCGGGHLESGAMGPCLGVFVYDPRTRVTWAGHFPPTSNIHDPETLLGMLDEAFKEFGSSRGIRVYVSGCCQCDVDGKPSRNWKDVRKFVEAELGRRRTAGTILEFRWPAAGTASVNMVLEPESGAFELEENGHSD